jgi:hypothetical protein
MTRSGIAGGGCSARLCRTVGTAARRCLVASVLLGGGAAMLPLDGAAAEPPSGTVTIEQVQVAFLGSGNLGGGTLTFQGRDYPFTIGGLGVGGIGVSSIKATGSVYGLKRVEDFEGAYGQARYGAVAGDASVGELWLENEAGVRMELAAKRQGLALSLGADAIFITLD